MRKCHPESLTSSYECCLVLGLDWSRRSFNRPSDGGRVEAGNVAKLSARHLVLVVPLEQVLGDGGEDFAHNPPIVAGVGG